MNHHEQQPRAVMCICIYAYYIVSVRHVLLFISCPSIMSLDNEEGSMRLRGAAARYVQHTTTLHIYILSFIIYFFNCVFSAQFLKSAMIKLYTKNTQHIICMSIQHKKAVFLGGCVLCGGVLSV